VCAVSTTLNLIGSWMASLAARLQADSVRSRTELEAAPVSQPLLRSTFDFGFFFEGMCLIFESEHAQVLLKGIEFLYRHWDLLPEDQAIKLRGLILGDCYWRLLLHWAPAVRKFFAHLAVFRLCRPCMWSLDGYGALPELPPQLVVRFERRAMRLAQIAQAYTAHVAVAVAKGEAPSPSSVAPALAAATRPGSAPAPARRRRRRLRGGCSPKGIAFGTAAAAKLACCRGLLLLLLLLLERVRRAVVRLERVAARSATASKPEEAHIYLRLYSLLGRSSAPPLLAFE
jgi:hypothetical protein